jgi:hypothetical protein
MVQLTMSIEIPLGSLAEPSEQVSSNIVQQAAGQFSHAMQLLSSLRDNCIASCSRSAREKKTLFFTRNLQEKQLLYWPTYYSYIKSDLERIFLLGEAAKSGSIWA